MVDFTSVLGEGTQYLPRGQAYVKQRQMTSDSYLVQNAALSFWGNLRLQPVCHMDTWTSMDEGGIVILITGYSLLISKPLSGLFICLLWQTARVGNLPGMA